MLSCCHRVATFQQFPTGTTVSYSQSQEIYMEDLFSVDTETNSFTIA